MRSDITPGQTSDYLGFDLIMDDNLPEPSVLLADRGYDSDRVRETMEARNVVPVIPMRKSRKLRVAVDRTLYRLRNLVERCFNKLKNARRVATRYDKTAESFLGFIDITSIRIRKPSPKYQLLHYARMSAINDTTPTHAQSHGSDHLSLVSSFGADNEEQKQFAKFQGRRWVSKRGRCLLELPWLAKSPRLIPAARVRLTNPRDLTDRPRRVRDPGLHMSDATHRAFRNWVDRACQFQRVSKEK